MKRFLAVAAAAGVGLAGVPAAQAAPGAAGPVPVTAGGIAWTPCPDNDPILGSLLRGLECGSLLVPLDYARPGGTKISIALTRARHTAPDSAYQGIVLLNRGGPGGYGRDLPTRFARGTFGLPQSVASAYDWVGFDPRGVAASEPQVACEPTYLYPGKARPDYVPANAAEEQVWLAKAKAYADSCGELYGPALRQLGTKNVARDMDRIRQALGQRQTSYFGYSYGTYLGSVYASMFPGQVRRMVLDSVVRPSGVWYEDNLDQNEAFEKRIDTFFAWVAEYDSVYGLGDTAAEVEAAYYEGLEMVRRTPIDGKIGPAEYNDVFVADAYRNYSWIDHAQVLADWVLRGDPDGLRANFGEPDFLAQNSFAMYAAVECLDAAWPRNWTRWHAAHTRQYRAGNRFMTWNNAWFNAPCAFWPAPAERPQPIGAGNGGPSILLVQAEHDAATPAPGAFEVHSRFPTSRLVFEKGGVNHGASLSANADACLNGLVSAFFDTGAVPASRPGADAVCQAPPAPDPTAVTALTRMNVASPTAADPLLR